MGLGGGEERQNLLTVVNGDARGTRMGAGALGSGASPPGSGTPVEEHSYRNGVEAGDLCGSATEPIRRI